MTQVDTRGWTVDAAAWGARLALIRQRLALNVTEAAELTGIPSSTWTEWEQNHRSPRDLTAAANQIARATGCDYLWLLAGPQRASEGKR